MKGESIKCGSCGHRVRTGDVFKAGIFIKALKPDLIYLRFRCPKCRGAMEQLVESELDWSSIEGKRIRPGLTKGERKKFAKLGKITADEIIDFHYALEEKLR